MPKQEEDPRDESAEEENDGDDPQDGSDDASDPQDESDVAEEVVVQPTVSAPNPVASAAVGVGRRVKTDGKPAGRRKKGSGGMRAAPQQQRQEPVRVRDPKKPEEGDLLWPFVMEKCAERDIDPAYVTIRVARIDVGREETEGYLQGSAVLGDYNQTPAEAVYEAVVEKFHMNSEAAKRGSVLYNVIYSIKGDPGFSYRGQLKLPSSGEISRRRHNQWYPPQQNYGAPPGYGPPPGGYVPPPPPHREGPRGYDRRDHRDRDYDRDYEREREREPRRGFGAPPPHTQAPGYPPAPPGYPPNYYQPGYPPPQYRDREDRSMREEMRELRGFLRDVLLDRQQPHQQQQQPDWATINSYVQQMEKTLGVKLTVQPLVQPGQPVGLGAPPPGYYQQPGYPPQPQPSPERLDYDQTLARKVRSRIEKKVDSAIDQLFDPPKPQEEDEDDDFDDPKIDYETVETPVPFPGTQEPIRYARDKKTGDIHWFGTFISNPQIVTKYGEKALDIAGKFAEAARHAATGGLGGRPQMAAGLNGTQPPQHPASQQPPPPRQDDDDDGFRL